MNAWTFPDTFPSVAHVGTPSKLSRWTRSTWRRAEFTGDLHAVITYDLRMLAASGRWACL